MSFNGRPKPFNLPPLIITGTTTLTANSYNVIIANLTGNATLNLPNINSLIKGFTYNIKNNSAFILTVQANGAQLIDNANSVTMDANEAIELVANTAKWYSVFGPIASGDFVEFPPITETQQVFVNKGGDDTTGTGTPIQPFLTISKALQEIVDATPSKRYTIFVGAGTYAENINLKANVYINGDSWVNTILSGVVDINDESWNSGVTSVTSGFSNVNFTGLPEFDYSVRNSIAGKLDFTSVRFTAAVTFTGAGAGNETFMQNCYFLDDVTISFRVYRISNCTFGTSADIIINGVAGASTTVTLTGNSSIADLTATAPTGSITLDLISCPITGTVVADGLVNITATSDSLPNIAAVTLLNGANIAIVNWANYVGFTPTTPANWLTTVPTTLQGALDTLAVSAQQTSRLGVQNVNAFAGGGQNDATPLTRYFSVITVPGINASVKLPLGSEAIQGMVMIVKNSGGDNCNVFPNTNNSINALGDNTAIGVAGGATQMFILYTPTNWQTVL